MYFLLPSLSFLHFPFSSPVLPLFLLAGARCTFIIIRYVRSIYLEYEEYEKRAKGNFSSAVGAVGDASGGGG